MNLDGELSKVLILAQLHCVCACRDPSITLTQPAHLKLLMLMINQSSQPLLLNMLSPTFPLDYGLWLIACFFLFKTRFVLPLPPGTHFIALQCKWTPLGAISETPTETHDCKMVMLLHFDLSGPGEKERESVSTQRRRWCPDLLNNDSRSTPDRRERVEIVWRTFHCLKPALGWPVRLWVDAPGEAIWWKIKWSLWNPNSRIAE